MSGVSKQLRLLAIVVALIAIGTAGYFVRAKVTRDFTFVFAGSDSYGYNKLAEELLQHHRYALGPAPAPLHWARPPGYPLYVALVKGLTPATMSGGDGWAKLVRGNVWLEIVGTGLALSFLVWRMAGVLAALLALLLLMIGPFNAVATPAALTETFATFLLTATVALLVPPAMGSTRRGWMPAAGVVFAIGVLTRPDVLLIAPAFAAAAYGASRGSPGVLRRGGVLLAPAVIAFVLTMSPWVVRNLVAFHDPHPLGGRIDRYSRPVVHYQGSWAYLRAISRDWVPMTQLTTCFYDPSCSPRTVQFTSVATPYMDDYELGELNRLLDLRAKLGDSQEVSDGFQRLADRRRRIRPFLVEVTLPVERLHAMWIAEHDELMPPHSPVSSWRYYTRSLSQALVAAALLGALFLLLDARRRVAGLVLLAATIGRTSLMAYTFYSMPRYVLESVPCAYALAAGGLLSLLTFVGSALRRARSST